MSSAIVIRLFGLVGGPAPGDASLMRSFARCPRDRLVRAIAWYAWECRRGLPPTMHLTGLRLLIRGWDDFYMTTALPSGAEPVSIETPIQHRALVTRHGRAGRGWQKERLSTAGPVRPEVELAACWLSSVAGCIVHEDCAANPALGAACASAGGLPAERGLP
jgi:hypothetical protein